MRASTGARGVVGRMTAGSLWNPLAMIRHLLSLRELIGQLTRREVATVYRDSLLGALWTFIQPLMTLAVYTFVFTEIFQPRAGEGASQTVFVLGMFCGIVFYGVFADTISKAPILVISNPSYVKRVLFPLEALPVSVLGAALVNLCAGLLILIAGTLILGESVPATVFWLPVTLVPLFMLTLGISWFLASVGVFLRDVQQVVRVLLQAIFFLTPIVWTLDFLPPRFHFWVKLNPLTTIVESAREVAIAGRLPDWGMLGLITAISAVVMVAGYVWFMKTRHGFADVL